MTTMYEGELRGGTAATRAIALAGVLAESGLTRVEVETGGCRKTLDARQTDLPGCLAGGLCDGVVVRGEYETVVTFSVDAMGWRTESGAVAAGFARAVAWLAEDP